jgi:hypothetical protein
MPGGGAGRGWVCGWGYWLAVLAFLREMTSPWRPGGRARAASLTWVLGAWALPRRQDD